MCSQVTPGSDPRDTKQLSESESSDNFLPVSYNHFSSTKFDGCMTTVSHQLSKSLLNYGIQWDTHDPSATQDHTGPLANSKAFGRADTTPKNPDTQIEMSSHLSGDYVNHRDASETFRRGDDHRSEPGNYIDS
jgi:hypothetical protein